MSQKGNILLVANWESDVGYAWWLMENFWTTISSHFERQDIDCHLIYPKITQLPETIEKSRIVVHECDFQNHSPSNMVKLFRLIRAGHIKYIYLSDSPTYSFFYVLLRIWGIDKIVVHDHTPGERTKPAFLKKWLKSLIQNIPYFTADHFIAVTEYVYQRHININCIPENKCSIASNGIIPIKLDEIDRDYAFNTFNIPKDRLIIVTTGRASYYKGIDFFIKCANELVNRQNMAQLHFLFCGDGPDMDDFLQLTKTLNVKDHLTFAGKRTDIRSILPSCNVGFHAATGEVGYSLSILEYMSAGLLTIVPDNPSVSLATTHMETGILYKSRDIESATNAIKIALDSEISQPMRNNAIKKVHNEFSLQNTNKQLVEILAKVYV